MAKTNSITKSNVNVKTSAELLSYIINETPILRENIDLPKQGESINAIGKIIMNNIVYKNAFLNTINIIGINVITRNTWTNPWETFTNKGTLSHGQQVREIICDLADVYDYNEMLPIETDFIKTVVPNVLSYLHELNFQKFWKTTTSDEQMAMAFERGDLFSLVDQIVNMLYTSYQYDIYQVAKYILARRILDGTIPAYQITNFSTKTDREIVAEIKAQSNRMTFMSPNYNPAGIRKATNFDDQMAIVSSEFDARFSTMVLSTSYFRSDADMKARLELTESIGTIDTPRLNLLFAKRDSNGDIVDNEYVAGYVPISDEELASLDEIPVVLLDRDFFQFYKWSFGESENLEGLRKTEFFNPETYKTNHILGGWLVCSSSPFANCLVFTQTAQSVTSVTVSPSTATISAGNSLDFTATVVTTGFANKAVTWSVDSSSATAGVTISESGHLQIPSTFDLETITVTATSIYDSSVTGTATVTNASYSA